jgi:hypothetical protein
MNPILTTALLTALCIGIGALLTVKTKDGLNNADYFIDWDN